jgi:glycine/D-amino acid oxidase-like deaminating enzyme
VQFALNSNVTSLEVDDDAQRFLSVNIQEFGGASRKVPCNNIVVAAGPWSGHLFSSLFPSASIKLSMNAANSASNHFRVRIPGWKPSDDARGSEQVFLGNILPDGQELDITSFRGGSLYIGGYGATPETLPASADSVKAQPTHIEAMLELCRLFLKLKPGEELEVYDVGRAYRPLAAPNHPIIAKVDWHLLGLGDKEVNNPCERFTMNNDEGKCEFSPQVGGLYLNTAHNSDGLTLALGSGKVMSEMLLGKNPSINISGLGLSQSEVEKL